MGKIKGLVVSVVITSLLAGPGCVKKRPLVDAQNSELGDLTSVQAIQQWKHVINTSEDAPDISEVTNAEHLDVDPTLKEINIQGVVKFETNAPLLKEQINTIRLLGKPKTAYNVVYRLSPKYLTIYKEVPTDDVPTVEKPYATAMGNTSFIPLGGYSVTYYNVGRIKNDNNRDTNINTKFSVPNDKFQTAAYVRIDQSSWRPFKRLAKVDVMPADYFLRGEWYFAKSLVSTKPGEETAIGHFTGGQSTSFNMATRIKFSRTGDLLRAVDAAIAIQKLEFRDKSKSGDKKEIGDDVLSIPTKWEDYEPLESSADPLTEQLVQTRDLEKLKYGRFLFTATNMIEGMTFSEWVGSRVIRGSILKDLNFTPDSFSFRVLKLASGEEYRYAFRRVKPSSYEPRIYRKADEDTMGAFYTDVPYVVTSKIDRKGDIEATRLINRFDPKKKVITFRFSKETPKFEETKQDQNSLQIDYRAVGRNCVRYWNRAFELAETGMRVEIQEDKDSVVGDINNNIINIIDTLNESGLAGIGPTMADPQTGEIIAGAANVYVSAYRRGLTDQLRNYIRLRSGLVKDFAFPKSIQAERPLMGYFSKEVEHFCPDVVKFAVSLDGRPQTTSTAENAVIDRCLEKMLTRILTVVTCHEMGHVFNLRHNFQCSADQPNSYDANTLAKVFPKDQFPEIYRDLYPKKEFYPESSCVMDYMPFERPMLMLPGLYDIAAIAYSYSGKLIKADTRNSSKNGIGELIKFDTNRSLKEQPAFNQSQKFAYCPDEYAGRTYNTPPTNPFCMLHDYGNTPTKLMDYHFDSYREDIVFNFRKWDRAQAVPSEGRNLFHIELMAGIYKLWRVYLHDFVGSAEAYLQNYQDDESWAKLQKDLAANFKQKEYLGISERYVKYLSAIADIPDLFCVAVNSNANPRAINGNTDVRLFRFTDLQTEMAAFTSYVAGCSDPALVQYVQSKDNGKWKVVGDLGYPTADIRFSKDVKDVREGIDIVGIGESRKNGLDLLIGPQGKTLVYDLAVRQHAPWALDEPVIYKGAMERVTRRLFEGVDLALPVTELLNDKGYTVKDPQKILPYRKFYGNEINSYVVALNNLRLFRETQKDKVDEAYRQTVQIPFIAYDSKYLSKRLPGEAWYFEKVNQQFFFASPVNKIAYKALNTFLELQQMVRFDLAGIDSSAQDSYWQLSELVKSLPVTTEYAKPRLNMTVFRQFAQDVKGARVDEFITPILKGVLDAPVFAKITALADKIDQLYVIAGQREDVVSAAAVPGAAPMMSAAEANKLLTKISTQDSAFLEFMRSEGQLTREELTQMNLARLFVESRNNPRLNDHWTKTMEPTIRVRVAFFNEEPLEYTAQADSMIKNITQSLEWVHRDRM